MDEKKFIFRELPIGYVPYGKSIKAKAFVSNPFSGCEI